MLEVKAEGVPMKEINDKTISFAVSGYPCRGWRNRSKDEYVDGTYWEGRARETHKHSQGAHQALLLISMSVCTYAHVCVCTRTCFGYRLWLPWLPMLLEMPAAVMCCDRDWFLWLTALAGELFCHANEQIRRWVRLTADRQAAHLASHTCALRNRGFDDVQRQVQISLSWMWGHMTLYCRESPLTDN